MRTYLLYIFFLFISTASYSQSVVNSIPNPKEHGGGWVSNPDGILKQHEVDSINQIITEVERLTTAQMAVVVVQSIGDEAPKDVAYELFNKWGVGKKEKDNGLLLLIVMQPKRWEFETGYGLEGDLPDARLNRIGIEIMVPFFKQNEYGKGVIEGIQKIKQYLTTSTSETTDRGISESLDIHSKRNSPALFFLTVYFIILGIAAITALIIRYISKKKHNNQLSATTFYSLLLLPAALVGVNYILQGAFFDPEAFWPYLLLLYLQAALSHLINRIHKNKFIKGTDAYDEYLKMEKAHTYLTLWIVLSPLTMLPYLIKYKRHMKKLRNQPRISQSGRPMTRLTDAEEKPYLNKGQLKEQEVGSIDYDVWVTQEPSELKIEAYNNTLSSYTVCPKCNHKTNDFRGEQTVVRATYHNTGKGIKTWKCAHCNHITEKEFTIPILVAASQSNSSSSSSGSFSSSSSSSSFGGGSSGGGGAGGSW